MKRKAFLLVLLAVLLAIVVGSYASRRIDLNRIPWSAKRALEHPDQLTLYSVEPELRIQYPDSVERLHRHPVLGSVQISSAETRATIAQAVQHGVANWNRNRYLCFDPRHCVRVTRGAETFDFLICYECHRIYIYRGESQIGSVGITDAPNTLNDILRASNVPLPEPIQLQ